MQAALGRQKTAKFGGRRIVIAIPCQKLPNVMTGFKSEDNNLAFRVKNVFAENRNFTARAQSNRNVCSVFFCIHCEDIMEVVNYDLKFGYVFFGCILFVNRVLEITQGSPVSPGLADMKLSVIEEINNFFLLLKQEGG